MYSCIRLHWCISFCMLHVNTKTNTYQQSVIHVVCCIMFVHVKTVELYIAAWIWHNGSYFSCHYAIFKLLYIVLDLIWLRLLWQCKSQFKHCVRSDVKSVGNHTSKTAQIILARTLNQMHWLADKVTLPILTVQLELTVWIKDGREWLGIPILILPFWILHIPISPKSPVLFPFPPIPISTVNVKRQYVR